jgi:hypothetical protein
MATHSLVNLSNSSATLLSPYGRHSGVDITIQNVNDSGYIYLGSDSSVLSTNYGFRILPNHSISFELPGFDSLYAISSSNNMKAAVMITNLESGS